MGGSYFPVVPNNPYERRAPQNLDVPQEVAQTPIYAAGGYANEYYGGESFASSYDAAAETPDSARRRRLEELNSILMWKNPAEFARREAPKQQAPEMASLAQNQMISRAPLEMQNEDNSQITSEEFAYLNKQNAELAQMIRLLRADLNEALAARETAAKDALEIADAEPVVESKIRQASALEPATRPASLPQAPTRPNALQIAPRIFMSSEVVSLPPRGAVEEAQPLGAATGDEKLPTFKPASSGVSATKKQTTRAVAKPAPVPSSQTSQSASRAKAAVDSGARFRVVQD
ncbi:MAG: hypothetical protein HUK22_03100 [Thermoguttaceae bacterium]|nr:hypothetical protein [Thermoguttaceae bacterium]